MSLHFASFSPKNIRRFLFLVALSSTSTPPLFRSPIKRLVESDHIVRILHTAPLPSASARSYAVKNGLDRFSLYNPSFVPTQSRPSLSRNTVVQSLPSR